MSDQSGLKAELEVEGVAPLPAGPTAEPQTAGIKATHESNSTEDRKTFEDEVKEEEKEENQEKEEEWEDQEDEEEKDNQEEQEEDKVNQEKEEEWEDQEEEEEKEDNQEEQEGDKRNQEKEDEWEDQEEEEEKVSGSSLQEPSTLPWPGDKDKKLQADNDDEIHLGKAVSDPEERDTRISGGSPDLSEEQSQTESNLKGKAKWRESMPEGERWRDDEIQMQPYNKGDGSLADDEDDEQEEEEGEESHWISEKAALGFTPQVKIVRPSSKELPEESRVFIERDTEKEPQVEPKSAIQTYSNWDYEDEKFYMCEHVCSENAKLALGLVAAGLLFPLLVWLGYTYLPFDSPELVSAPLRVMYTLRCSFFAIVPILLGVVVEGMARLRYSALKPLYQSTMVNREVAVHWHFVHESLALFLFFFLQLAVMATYISQDLVKLVPLLTIIFVFGRLIYWLCLALDSSIRGFGFGFSFFPILVMLGINLYYVCASVGQGAVFDIAPPATAPTPRMRWWN